MTGEIAPSSGAAYFMKNRFATFMYSIIFSSASQEPNCDHDYSSAITLCKIYTHIKHARNLQIGLERRAGYIVKHVWFLPGRVHKNQTDFDQQLGYCQQHDALDELLTGTETLHFYAKLKGIDPSEIPQVCTPLSLSVCDRFHKKGFNYILLKQYITSARCKQIPPEL